MELDLLINMIKKERNIVLETMRKICGITSLDFFNGQLNAYNKILGMLEIGSIDSPFEDVN